MTAPSTDELTRLLAECTPGPWGWRWKTESLHVLHEPPYMFGVTVLAPSYEYDTGISANVSEPDAALIAAAPTIAADLIALRKAAEGMAEALLAVRDYSFDVSTGALTYRGGGDLSEMATEDLARIDAALAAYEELKP